MTNLTSTAVSTVEQSLPALAAALESVPGFVVEEEAVEEHLRTHDARLELKVDGRPLRLIIEFKREVFPLQAREILWQFRDYLREAPGGQATPFVLAHTITRAARDLFKEEGVGFFDSSGTLYLPAPGAFVFIDKPVPPIQRTREGSIYTYRRSQVVHALLREPQRWFGVGQLADTAQVAPATASEVLSVLDKLEWVKVQGQGPAKERMLAEPRQLLDGWAAAFKASKRPPLHRYFVPLQRTNNQDLEIAEVLERNGVQYALSHESGGQRLASLLTHVAKVRMRARVDAALDTALKELRAQPVTTGWNLGVWQSKDGDMLFRQQHDSVWVASVFHVYLDLVQSEEGRSKELAEHLRKERIRF